MNITVFPETLQAVPGSEFRKTVEIEIDGDRRRALAFEQFANEPANHRLVVYGIGVRFSSGAKVWPGSATYWFKSGNVNNLRPNIDKRGHFSLVGFFADFDQKPVASQHNAVR